MFNMALQNALLLFFSTHVDVLKKGSWNHGFESIALCTSTSRYQQKSCCPFTLGSEFVRKQHTSQRVLLHCAYIYENTIAFAFAWFELDFSLWIVSLLYLCTVVDHDLASKECKQTLYEAYELNKRLNGNVSDEDLKNLRRKQEEDKKQGPKSKRLKQTTIG